MGGVRGNFEYSWGPLWEESEAILSTAGDHFGWNRNEFRVEATVGQ